MNEVMEHQSIEELEFRIWLNNMIVKWLRSNDPFLREPKHAKLLPERLAHHEKIRNEMLAICREKKHARNGGRNGHPPVSVKLKSARLIGKSGMT
jgi:hypothetical protein